MGKKYKKSSIIFFVFVGFFASIGFLFSAVFVAMEFDLLAVKGTIDKRNTFFTEAQQELRTIFPTSSSTPMGATTTVSTAISEGGGSESERQFCRSEGVTVCSWDATSEWDVVKSGLIKDSALIARVSKETGVEARMIVSVVVPEQLRFFTSNREVFKRWFEPMKILGTLTKFSLGVSGIKLETAIDVEKYAQDPSSVFYPGNDMRELIAYDQTIVDTQKELYDRLTNENDHYYSYLYTALFIREIKAQWSLAGYDVSKNPGVIVTLFNIGFEHSFPNANPLTGGAEITVGGTSYSYGELGSYFYFSNELRDVFPE